MFAEPISITVNAVAQSMNRTAMGVNSGAFAKDDGSHRLSISHSLGNFNQRIIRLDRKQTVADPLTTGEYYETTDSVWLVTRTPKSGLTLVQQKHLVDGFLTYLSASSGAAVTKLLGGES
nr:MAG: hypothetical protein 1 [Leviviridae sp.]